LRVRDGCAGADRGTFTGPATGCDTRQAALLDGAGALVIAGTGGFCRAADSGLSNAVVSVLEGWFRGAMEGFGNHRISDNNPLANAIGSVASFCGTRRHFDLTLE